MFDLIFFPLESAENVDEASKGKVALYLVLSGLLYAISALIFLGLPFTGNKVLGALGVWLGFIIGVFVFSFIFTKTLNVLESDDVSFKEGLTTIVYAKAVAAPLVLIGMILSLIPYVGTIFALIAFFIGILLGSVIFFRSAKEAFGTDLLTILVAEAIILGALGYAFYLAAIASPELLMLMLTPPA